MNQYYRDIVDSDAADQSPNVAIIAIHSSISLLDSACSIKELVVVKIVKAYLRCMSVIAISYESSRCRRHRTSGGKGSSACNREGIIVEST